MLPIKICQHISISDLRKNLIENKIIDETDDLVEILEIKDNFIMPKSVAFCFLPEVMDFYQKDSKIYKITEYLNNTLKDKILFIDADTFEQSFSFQLEEPISKIGGTIKDWNMTY